MWVRALATGVVEAEEDEALLDAELMPEVSGDDWEADSQNCGGARSAVALSPGGRPTPALGAGRGFLLWMRREGGGEGTLGPGREGLRRAGGIITFFSWPSGDSGTKLMAISSTSELEEPAEWTLSASARSPLPR